MGGDLCKGNATTRDISIKASDIFLSNPLSVTKDQIRKSANNKIDDLIGSYVGPDTSLILGCKKDQRQDLLNKYLLTYLFFIKNKSGNPQVQINDFCTLLKILDRENQSTLQIVQFQVQYTGKSTPKEKSEYLINEYFKNGFFSSSIEKFPIYSSDPSILGFARRPLLDLSKGIKTKYERQDKKKEIYCVVQFSKNEEKLLQKMAEEQDFFTFSTFVRCFSNENKARKRLKELQKVGKDIRQSHNLATSTVLLNIQIPSEEVDAEYDYGFYQDEKQKENPLGDIMMNIMNFFSVTGAEPQNKTYDLKYNSLARLIHMRRERLLSSEPDMLKVMTVIEGQSQEIKTHSALIRLVADRRLSITASQTLKNSSGLKQNSEENERINLIEAYLEQKEYEKALQECQGKNTAQFKVRMAQIFYESKKYPEAESAIKQLEPSKAALKKQHFKQYVIYEFLCAKIRKNKGENKGARNHLQILSDAMKKEYKGSYEYRGREVEKELEELNKKDETAVGSSAGTVNPPQNAVQWATYANGLNVGVLLSH